MMRVGAAEMSLMLAVQQQVKTALKGRYRISASLDTSSIRVMGSGQPSACGGGWETRGSYGRAPTTPRGQQLGGRWERHTGIRARGGRRPPTRRARPPLGKRPSASARHRHNARRLKYSRYSNKGRSFTWPGSYKRADSKQKYET